MIRSIAAIGFVALSNPVWAQSEITIAALGDSLTQGFGLPEADGFVPQLSDWLSANGVEATLINAGVSGDTTQGGLSRISWTLTPDVDGLILALGGNDLLRGIDPALSRQNLEGILQVAQAADVNVMLVGIEAPGNYGPDYKAAFDAIFPELATQYGALYYPSFFAAFEGQADVPAELGAFIQADGIHPSAQGVEAIVADMGPLVLDLIATLE
ncbi:MAG: arylesterase [Pseudomonadota bacterium]